MTLRKVYKKIRKVIIYEIVCNITGERYIGSTIQRLSQRKGSHKRCNKCESRKIINRGNYKVNELETFNSRFELAKLLKEQYYLDNYTNINKQNAYTNKKKYNKLLYINQREKIIKRTALYSKQHREIYNERERNKKTMMCPCGGNYKHRFKSKHFKTKRHIKYEVSAVLENIIAILEK